MCEIYLFLDEKKLKFINMKNVKNTLFNKIIQPHSNYLKFIKNHKYKIKREYLNIIWTPPKFIIFDDFQQIRENVLKSVL